MKSQDIGKGVDCQIRRNVADVKDFTNDWLLYQATEEKRKEEMFGDREVSLKIEK